MTLSGVMAIILHYFAEFGSFRGQLRKSGWLVINRFSLEKCHKLHQLSMMDALWSTWQWSFLLVVHFKLLAITLLSQRSQNLLGNSSRQTQVGRILLVINAYSPRIAMCQQTGSDRTVVPSCRQFCRHHSPNMELLAFWRLPAFFLLLWSIQWPTVCLQERIPLELPMRKSWRTWLGDDGLTWQQQQFIQEISKLGTEWTNGNGNGNGKCRFI